MTQNSINNTSSELTVDNLFLDGNTLSSLDTNGDIVLAPDGSGVISVTSSPIVPSGDRAENLGSTTNAWDNLYCDGISFDDGTNVLDTYVSETSWTPTIAGSTTAGVGTYSHQRGWYIRIGDLVFLTFDVSWTAHTGTGNLLVDNLPFLFTQKTFGTIQLYGGSWTYPANGLWCTLQLNATDNIQLIFSLTDGNQSFLSLTSNTNNSLKGSIFGYLH